MMHEFAESGHTVHRCSNARKEEKFQLTTNTEPSSAEMLMKTILSVFTKQTLTWYLERRSEEDDVSADAIFNISQKLVTKLSRHETSFLFVRFGVTKWTAFRSRKTVPSNSRAGDKLLAKQGSRCLWKWDNTS